MLPAAVAESGLLKLMITWVIRCRVDRNARLDTSGPAVLAAAAAAVDPVLPLLVVVAAVVVVVVFPAVLPADEFDVVEVVVPAVDAAPFEPAVLAAGVLPAAGVPAGLAV